MKRIVYLFIALLMMTTVKAQTLTEHEVQEGASTTQAPEISVTRSL